MGPYPHRPDPGRSPRNARSEVDDGSWVILAACRTDLSVRYAAWDTAVSPHAGDRVQDRFLVFGRGKFASILDRDRLTESRVPQLLHESLLRLRRVHISDDPKAGVVTRQGGPPHSELLLEEPDRGPDIGVTPVPLAVVDDRLDVTTKAVAIGATEHRRTLPAIFPGEKTETTRLVRVERLAASVARQAAMVFLPLAHDNTLLSAEAPVDAARSSPSKPRAMERPELPGSGRRVRTRTVALCRGCSPDFEFLVRSEIGRTNSSCSAECILSC